MKNLVLFLALSALISGCAMFHKNCCGKNEQKDWEGGKCSAKAEDWEGGQQPDATDYKFQTAK